ncbi:MAG TPA: hypothetical protein VLJ58_15530 [Ramlibacter sp.]|nr:hypothetical protein [Ramlibacter sp.]
MDERNKPVQDDLTIPPMFGRAGRGAASILPHLQKQVQTQLPMHSDFNSPKFDDELPSAGEAPKR